MTQSQLITALHPAYFTLFPQSEFVTSRAHGIDISKYDQFFRPELATSQLDFVVQRVSYGTTRDEKFADLVDAVMTIPIRGGYHYLSSWMDWKLQADKYLSFISGYEYHWHNCDFEAYANQLSTGFAYQAWKWIHYVQDKTGKPALLYTSPSHYNDYIYPSQNIYGINWNDVDLWQAQWFFVPNPNGTPPLPNGRTKPWKKWQYTDKGDGTKYGVARPTACDLDVYNGTVQQMSDWLGITPTPMPTGTGGSMFFKVQSTSSNLRSSAGVQTNPSNDLGDGDNLNVVFGDIVETEDASITISGTTWRKVLRWWRANIKKMLPPSPTGEVWVAEKGSAVWLISTIFNPPPEPSTDYILHFKSDGTVQKYIPE